ncbi:unnamed protein product, partial [Ceratitis capitata]
MIVKITTKPTLDASFCCCYLANFSTSFSALNTSNCEIFYAAFNCIRCRVLQVRQAVAQHMQMH